MIAQTRSARWTTTVLAASLAALLGACGGGDDSSSGGTSDTAGTVPSCNTAAFQAGTVEQPTATQMGAYAGTYAGDEGAYSTGSGVFIKSGTATMVLGADAKLSYKGTAYTALSVCIDKAEGTYGRILYVHTEKGHFDISNKVDATLGQAWGVSPADGATVFTNGKKS